MFHVYWPIKPSKVESASEKRGREEIMITTKMKEHPVGQR
jgi:hypothetical protein